MAVTGTLYAWQMVEAGKPLELVEAPLPQPADDQVLLEITACGLCHTDVSFLYGGVHTRAGLPLTLGHEILGRVVADGGDTGLLGRTVIVPAVVPCGSCALCDSGRGNVCMRQLMPGNDFHGGFASHAVTPARHLVPVPEALEGRPELAVVGDAVATAYQSVVRSGLGEREMLVVVGAGGVGTFAVQSARLLGAHIAAIDISEDRLASVAKWVDLSLDASVLDPREIKAAVVAYEKENGLPRHGRKILECSGSAAGQQTAYSLLTFDSTLVVVGFTRDKIPIRLSNLMAFDARAIGNWGCLPERFARLVDLIADGELEIEPFVELHPMSRLNDLLLEESPRRPVLIPDF
jgi:6-hydroxycyclohex-1-ene-1-carbonyl-CoA dehydrogenase